MRTLRILIWIYLGFLIVEGALRKWVLPWLSDPLLIIRDPIVILIYLQALRIGLFPANMWTKATGLLAIGALAAGSLAEFVNPWVMAYGLRTDFLPLPLVFIMPRALDDVEVKKMGKIFLWLAPPMSLLMALQFRSAPTAWINAGAGGGGQLQAALGKIRPAATFSFVSGPILFFSTVTAFLLFGLLKKRTYPIWLLGIAGGSTMVAAAVSGSRSLLAGVIMVCLSMIAELILHPRALIDAIRLIAVMAVLFVAVSSTKIFSEGQAVLKARIANATGGREAATSLLQRILSEFLPPDEVLFGTPLFGKGLGLGTNAGAGIMGVRGHFLLAEGEWARIYSESGPVAGTLIILLRILLAGYILWLAATSAHEGRFLPMLLFGAGGMGLLIGPWGQPTSQGFATFLSGLCLAAAKTPAEAQPATVLAEVDLIGTTAEARSAPARPGRRRKAILGMDPQQPGRFAIRA